MNGDKAAVTRHGAPASICSLARYSVKGLPYGAVEVSCTWCGMLALFSSAGHVDLALSDLAVWGRCHLCLASERELVMTLCPPMLSARSPAGSGGSRPGA